MARFGRKATRRKEKKPVTISEDSGPSKAAHVSRTASEQVSIYHIYHKGEFHHCLTPKRDEYKDKVWPSCSETKAYRQEKREKKRQERLRPPDAKEPETEAPGFFVHKPRLWFGHPPRTLRYGQSKHGTPICLIHNSGLWRKWRIQFCDGLDEPGVVDPRGVVGAESGHASKQDSVRQGGNKHNGFVQGYPVKKWRFWGDTGKRYHQDVNRRKREGENPSLGQGKPLEVSTAINLTWHSPFSPRTRRYNFRYGDLDFCWKGTGTVEHPGFCGAFTRFNHLKLVVQVPAGGAFDTEPAAGVGHTMGMDRGTDGFGGSQKAFPQTREIFLATYTSSPAARKSGVLEVRDSEFLWLLDSYFPKERTDVETRKELGDDIAGTSLGGELPGRERLAESQLYQCIIATAMCMVIAEHQKREVVRSILELAAGEAGNAGG